MLGTTTKLKLDDAVFGASLNKSLIHDSVRAELNARRRGTAATKTRGLVSGGGGSLGKHPDWRRRLRLADVLLERDAARVRQD
jgi:ribosomal protein L4